jgi:hypothetical protein
MIKSLQGKQKHGEQVQPTQNTCSTKPNDKGRWLTLFDGFGVHLNISQLMAVHGVSPITGYRMRGFTPRLGLTLEVWVTVQAQLDSQRHQGGTVCNWADVRTNHGAELTGGAATVTCRGVFLDHLDVALLLLSHGLSFSGYGLRCGTIATAQL